MFNRKQRLGQIKTFTIPNIDIVEDTEYDPSEYNVLMVGISNDILPYLPNHVALLKEMSTLFNRVEMFIGANNFKSHETLNPFVQRDMLGHVACLLDNFHYHLFPDSYIHKDSRIKELSKLRQQTLEEARIKLGEDFDYIIVFDVDSRNAVGKDIVKSLAIKNSWSCISGNMCYNRQPYYYDDLALRLIADPIDVRELHKNFDEYYGINSQWVNEYKIFDCWTKVRAAFGGLSIYKAKEIFNLMDTRENIYSIESFPADTCEHIPLCLSLQNDILISPYINIETHAELEVNIVKYAFIPRDAGFFSVFNFLVGSMCKMNQPYPFWNKEALKARNNGVNEHFAYWTEHTNCWFDYFEPVKYFEHDYTHRNGEYLTFKAGSGEDSDDKFKLPKSTANLMRNFPAEFEDWRQKTHSIYKKHIKFRSDILAEADNFWEKNFQPHDYVIGVHYRHPSHFVESGKVYLQDYFGRIDKILETYPDSKIFLASDSRFGVYAFLDKYGPDKVKLFDDIDRISMSEFLEWAFSLGEGKPDVVGFVNGKGYELHHKRVEVENNKKMTIDLLKEVLCLSKCNVLINTVSNIPLAISYMNPSINIQTI